MQNIFMDTNGVMRDQIVERMYHDIKTTAYHDDRITLHNFCVYVEQFYGIELTPKALTACSFVGTHLASLVFNKTIIRKNKSSTGVALFACRNDDWGDKTIYAQHVSLGTAILLAIVQDMRYKISAKLPTGGTA